MTYSLTHSLTCVDTLICLKFKQKKVRSGLKVKKGYRDAENLIRESREIEILIRGLKFIIQTLTSCSPVSPQLVLKYLNIKLSIMNYDCQNKSTLPSSHFVPLFHTFSEIFSSNFFWKSQDLFWYLTRSKSSQNQSFAEFFLSTNDFANIIEICGNFALLAQAPLLHPN